MLRAWFNMWKDMFKFFPPHRIGRREFAFAMVGNAIFIGCFFASFYIFPEAFLILLLNLFGIALSSLFVRRLRDAGFISLLALLPYGWALFWWFFSYFVHGDDSVTVAFIGGFGFFPIGILILILCVFPTKERKEFKAPKTQNNKPQIQEISLPQAWINFWKNIFKFQAPHRTNRREFALDIIGSIVFFFIMMSGMPIMQNLLYGIIWSFVMLFFMLAFLSLIARRLRDAGFSVWWLVPPVILILVCMLLSQFLEFFISFIFVFSYFYPIILLVMCAFPTKEKGEILSTPKNQINHKSRKATRN